MTAALETALIAARLGIPDLPHGDHAAMEKAILNSAATGERDFKQLQQRAIDALGARAVDSALKPVERRKQFRLVEGSKDRRGR
jgi:hypothetical protein